MALTVRDILELPSGQRMHQVAGTGGLDRPVITVEIADYEFAPGIEEDIRGEVPAMEPDGFVITSFLFARDDPDLILPAVRAMIDQGMSALAYKQIFYDDLPRDVLDYAEERDFPVFSFGRDVWFENIIFDIMYAVQFDDKVYLSEEKIRSMLSGKMGRSELDIILKGISLKLQSFLSAAYIWDPDGRIDTGRILRSFYLSKGLREKALMIRYGNDLLLIITSPISDLQAHRLILKQVLETSGLPAPGNGPDPAGKRAAGKRRAGAEGGTKKEAPHILWALSDVHPSDHLDQAFRESWYCFIAMQAEPARPAFDHFGGSGIYRLLLPTISSREASSFAASILDPISGFPDLSETVRIYAASGGDIGRTADALCCHPNTVRYRLGRIRELAGLSGCSDPELFMYLRLAAAIRGASEAIGRDQG